MPEGAIWDIMRGMGAVTRSKAGESAWKAYRRNLLPNAIFALLLIVGCSAFVALIANDQLSTLGSLLLFACLTALFVVWNRNLDAISERWGAGAEGEVRVGRELERLHKEGFYVFHDWDSGRGNVDHFAIGPQGVFVVETKAFTGEITCQDGKLLRNGRPVAGKDATKQAMAEAMAVRDLLRSSSGIEAFVQPILCFSDAQLSCYRPLNGVELTNVGSLNRYVATQRERYSDKEVRAIARLLEKTLGVGPAAGPDLLPEQPSGLGAFLARDRNLVLGMTLVLFILTVVFPGTTANFFGGTEAFYRSLDAIGSTLP